MYVRNREDLIRIVQRTDWNERGYIEILRLDFSDAVTQWIQIPEYETGVALQELFVLEHPVVTSYVLLTVETVYTTPGQRLEPEV